MIDAFIMFLGSIGGGAMTGLITVAVMRNDIGWLKSITANHGERIHKLETKGCKA